jgi:outer membrane protein OmpA-like peptidoglycan-associated protein
MYRQKSQIVKKASGLALLAFSFFSGVTAQQITPLKVLNSPYDEQHPVFSPNGELFFTVGFHPQNTGGATDFGDIWTSSKDAQGNWLPPKRVEGISTSGNDVVVGFSDALTILVYHSGGANMRQGIHQYTRFGSSWNYVRPMEISNFKNNSSYFSGRLSHDGEVIMMSMSSFGTYGNEDIYVTIKKDDGTWTAPLNLGSSVNSFAQEQTPYLSKDNMTLYFASNKLGNRQGKDIFYSQRSGSGWEDWAEPVRVETVNSQGSEMSYVTYGPDPTKAIFSTTQNSEGFGDFMLAEFLKVEPLTARENQIEVVEVPEPEAIVPVVQEVAPVVEEIPVPAKAEPVEQPAVAKALPVVEKEVKQDVAVPVLEVKEPVYTKKEWLSVKVVDAITNEEIGYQLEVSNDRGVKKPISTQQEWLDLSEDPQWTNILIQSKGFIPQLVSKEYWEGLQGKELALKPAKVGSAIVLENIQFNRGTSDFADAKSIQVLDNLVGFMKENPGIKIRLEGHTDNAGDPSLNKDLSMKRASKIRGYLTINGIEFERVRISGWGGTRPVADNNTEDGRERNRRVEMVIEN